MGVTRVLKVWLFESIVEKKERYGVPLTNICQYLNQLSWNLSVGNRILFSTLVIICENGLDTNNTVYGVNE